MPIKPPRGSTRASLLNDAAHWRARAHAARMIVEDTPQMETQRRMKELAAEFDELAQKAEQRAAEMQAGPVQPGMMTPAQCPDGRLLAGLSIVELASAARLRARLVADFEIGAATPQPADIDAMQAALERAGVVFVEENGHGPGVRLRK